MFSNEKNVNTGFPSCDGCLWRWAACALPSIHWGCHGDQTAVGMFSDWRTEQAAWHDWSMTELSQLQARHMLWSKWQADRCFFHFFPSVSSFNDVCWDFRLNLCGLFCCALRVCVALELASAGYLSFSLLNFAQLNMCFVQLVKVWTWFILAIYLAVKIRIWFVFS